MTLNKNIDRFLRKEKDKSVYDPFIVSMTKFTGKKSFLKGFGIIGEEHLVTRKVSTKGRATQRKFCHGQHGSPVTGKTQTTWLLALRLMW